MNIETKFLGQLTIEETEIIHFSNGLPGFEENKEFVILPLEKDSPFAILQSIKQKEIGFVIALPFLFKEDYAFDISEEDKEELQIEAVGDILTYSIVTLKEPFNNSTINLQAPVIINHKRKIAKQLVLHENSHQLRYPIEGGKL
ncbi:flagellar assembly protein FliW [Psychrobacillus psychrodurans]|uniref:Flagellar assembly factor FliW n=1 Tax=Psychrobacillus psychrodurans TaxID=126157 RepID=A0A9X3L950_9BACI|nr:flagellar assembly protein FliW [Psychrobacillus psychrodurans]MCZ8531834.1 flagellar assembly protein FliW [Psychrobacillus psychrodurans]